MSRPSQTTLDQDGVRAVVVGYEPPRVEKVLSPAALEQEILYAGADTLSEDADGTST